MFGNNNGQSMITAMAATAVSLVGITAATESLNFSFQGSNVVDSRANLATTYQLVELILEDSENCSQAIKTIGGGTPSFSDSANIADVNSIELSAGNSILSVGQKFGDYAIAKITLERSGNPIRYSSTDKFFPPVCQSICEQWDSRKY